MNQINTLPIIGMSCSACAISIENMLNKQEGVIKANVNYANASLLVEIDSQKTSIPKIQASVKSLGYDLIINEENQSEIVEKLETEKLTEIKNKMIGASILAFPVFIIGMFFMEMPFANYIMMVLAFPVVFYFGRHFFINAYKQALHKTTNMDTLVALSTGIAYIFSLFNTFFPEYWHSKGIHAHVYFESAAVIIAFINLGKWLEEKAKSNTSDAIKKLIGLKPKTVTVFENLIEKIIAINEVKIGQMVVVKPGDYIPVDGVVSYGESYVDESMVTGEPLSVYKKNGDKVTSGTLNQQGSFVFEATKVGEETFLSRIIKMVQEAQGSKAPIQKKVDKIAQIFVPTVIVISVFTFIAWIFLGGENGFTHALLSSITVLIIACPCALGLATPTAIMVGIGKGAANNILVKNAESLELLAKVDAFILDKTGTITEGKPSVTDSWENILFTTSEKDILNSIASKSAHPLSDSVVSFLNSSSSKHEIAIENISGKGLKAFVENKNYYVGSYNLLLEIGLEIELELSSKINMWQNNGYTLVLFFTENKVLSAYAITDKIKNTSKKAIELLKNKGIELYILSGDTAMATKKIADDVNISHYEGDMLPLNKANFVKKLQMEGKIVAMIGDGINDSQAMAQADVSIAMGKGSDIAIDVAHLTLVTSDLLVIPKAIQLSISTIKTINQNLFWAFIYNIIGIPIAAGMLYPINGFLLDPMIAGGAMALSSVSVVVNSLRLKYI